MLFQNRLQLCDLADLLTDGDVDANQVAALWLMIVSVQNSRLARGTVADDELALSAANRHHRVNCLHPRLHRDVNRLAGRNVGGKELDRPSLGRANRALAVDGPAEAVDDATEQSLTYGHLGDSARAAHLAALFNSEGVAHDDRSYAVLLEVERHSDDTALEFKKLVGPDSGEAVDPGDTVSHLNDGANVDHREFLTKLLDLALDYGRYVLSSYCHVTLRLLRTAH